MRQCDTDLDCGFAAKAVGLDPVTMEKPYSMLRAECISGRDMFSLACEYSMAIDLLRATNRLK
jgi:hypothetical protein